jgi:hypothetical protein
MTIPKSLLLALLTLAGCATSTGPDSGPVAARPKWRGVAHVCDRWPEKCQPADPSVPQAQLGLVCCGDNWCLAITLNSECGPSGQVYYCAHGESIMNEQGLPDVICHD